MLKCKISQMTHLETDLYEFLHFLEGLNLPNQQNSQPMKIAKVDFT